MTITVISKLLQDEVYLNFSSISSIGVCRQGEYKDNTQVNLVQGFVHNVDVSYEDMKGLLDSASNKHYHFIELTVVDEERLDGMLYKDKCYVSACHIGAFHHNKYGKGSIISLPNQNFLHVEEDRMEIQERISEAMAKHYVRRHDKNIWGAG